MKHFRTFLIFFTVLLIVGIGCKGLSQQEQASVRPIRLTYWTVFGNVDTLRQFASAYTAERPHVRVDIRQVRYEEFDDLLVNALADDVGPDIISVQAKWLREYEPRLSPMPSSVKISNVTIEGKYAKETVITTENKSLPTPSNIQNNYVAGIADDVIVNGNVLGLPLSFDTLAIFYNKTLLDQSGIATAPTNWEEFQSAVTKSTRLNPAGTIVQSGVALGTGNNISNAADILAVLMMQNGIDVMRGNAVTFALGAERASDTHPSLEALRFYTDFARPTKEVYSWNEAMPDALETFIQGRSVFYFGYSYDLDRIRARAPQMNLGTIALPQLNPDKPGNVADYWVEGVTKKSAHQDDAWDFIRFISTASNVETYTNTAKRPSPLRIHLDLQSQDPILGPFASQALTATNWYNGRNSAAATSDMAELLHAYLQPYDETVSPEKRDRDLLIRAARKIQQTI